MKSFLILLVILSSCSFKHPDQSSKSSDPLSVDSSLDSDGDGVPDPQEVLNGSNPFVADIPNFQGEFFSEMKVTTTFFDPTSNQTKEVSFQVRRNLTSENGSPVEERDFLSKGTQFFSEQNALLAKKAGYQVSYLSADLNAEDIGYYAPPRMNDRNIFPFSEKVLDLSRTMEFEEINFTISNRMLFSYLNSQTYSDLVFDLYWYDDTQKTFKLIGSEFLNGSYLFNEEYIVPLHFKTGIKELVREISVAGGRFLYLKLRDFKILETGKFFKQIISEVKEKSVPILFYDGDSEVLKYVGVNGQSLGLEEILKRSLSEKFLIMNSKVISIGKKTEENTIERDAFKESTEVKYRWQILTSEISNNPFSYSFGLNDVISLSYLSSENGFGLIPSYIGASISSSFPKTIKTIKVLSSGLTDLRINLRPKSVAFTQQNITRSSPCSFGSGASPCWKYETQTVTLSGIQALPISGLIYLNINGVEFRLDDLINQKDALYRIKNSEVIEFKLKNSLLNKIAPSPGLTITFFTKASSVITCSGYKSCESRAGSCDKYLNNPPSCTETSNSNFYQLEDHTQKSEAPIVGESFMSIEYI
jgi:hypothetical protein